MANELYKSKININFNKIIIRLFYLKWLPLGGWGENVKGGRGKRQN